MRPITRNSDNEGTYSDENAFPIEAHLNTLKDKAGTGNAAIRSTISETSIAQPTVTVNVANTTELQSIDRTVNTQTDKNDIVPNINVHPNQALDPREQAQANTTHCQMTHDPSITSNHAMIHGSGDGIAMNISKTDTPAVVIDLTVSDVMNNTIGNHKVHDKVNTTQHTNVKSLNKTGNTNHTADHAIKLNDNAIDINKTTTNGQDQAERRPPPNNTNTNNATTSIIPKTGTAVKRKIVVIDHNETSSSSASNKKTSAIEKLMDKTLHTNNKRINATIEGKAMITTANTTPSENTIDKINRTTNMDQTASSMNTTACSMIADNTTDNINKTIKTPYVNEGTSSKPMNDIRVKDIQNTSHTHTPANIIVPMDTNDPSASSEKVLSHHELTLEAADKIAAMRQAAMHKVVSDFKKQYHEILNGDGFTHSELSRLMKSEEAQSNKDLYYMLGSFRVVVAVERKIVDAFDNVAHIAQWLIHATEVSHNRYLQYNLGFYYEHALGVDQDYSKAVNLYTSSADKGYAPAMGRLGYCYLKGNGVGVDKVEAWQLFIQSVNTLPVLEPKWRRTIQNLETMMPELLTQSNLRYQNHSSSIRHSTEVYNGVQSRPISKRVVHVLPDDNTRDQQLVEYHGRSSNAYKGRGAVGLLDKRQLSTCR